MRMVTLPVLSRDLQRHLGGQIGAAHAKVLDEPLPAEMQHLLDRLSGRPAAADLRLAAGPENTGTSNTGT